MTVEISALALLLAVVVLLMRRSGLNSGHALACVLLGFFLAGSRAGPGIGRLLESLVDALEGIHL